MSNKWKGTNFKNKETVDGTKKPIKPTRWNTTIKI
jgi:hypothetical protein